jgi:hypothetical protein
LDGGDAIANGLGNGAAMFPAGFVQLMLIPGLATGIEGLETIHGIGDDFHGPQVLAELWRQLLQLAGHFFFH